MHDCIIVRPLSELPIDSEGDFVESDVEMGGGDIDEDEIEERMEGVMFRS